MENKLPRIPKRIHVNLGDCHKVQEKIINYFLETRNYLEGKFGENPNFEIEVKNMEDSDNHLHHLNYKDQTVAAVIERRTEFNNLEYTFFRNFFNLK